MRNASAPAPLLTRRKLYIAMVAASQLMLAGQSYASPEGGQVVGGAGKIDQSGKETVIRQQTERMAVDWQSFDVKADERVQFIQPGASSVALNRVISNKGSEILGRIDANGQVFLVNPNGVVFGKDSQINVGGILASGLSINPTDFMNGNFTLSEVEGAAGKVVSSGIINAATGGSVTLLGKEVTNDGLIIANLGAVNLAVGKEAVVTFDNNGLVGVKVTKEVLQSELGVDAALINSGEIKAEGGRILLTASTSQDIFSEAVNHGGMNAATSVVVNDDGSFTLGGGADVVNTGKISTGTATGDAGQIVVLGDKVTNSGIISADSQTGNGGHIELNSKDTTILNKTASVSAQSIAIGKGGDIKILGNKVGLMDTANINASGVNGGGQVLIGGDETGRNKSINNANFIYLGEKTHVKTDALLNGNGGKLITFAQDTARIYGNLSSRGGSERGNGGFIETSGLKGFDILNSPDIFAPNGLGGTWLIDPYSINITNNGGGLNNVNGEFATSNSNSNLSVTVLRGALNSGGNVLVRTGTGDLPGTTTGGDITLDASANITKISGSNSTLRLEAYNNIVLNGNITNTSDDGLLNVELAANYNKNAANKVGSGTGGVTIASGKSITTKGGYFTAGTVINRIASFNSSDATIDTSDDFGGGNISIAATGNVSLGAVNFSYDHEEANAQNLVRVGNITIDSLADVTLTKDIDFSNTGRRTNLGGEAYKNDALDGQETTLLINAGNDININGKIYDSFGDARDALNITLTAGSAINIAANKNIYTSGGNFTATANSFDSHSSLIDTDNSNDDNGNNPEIANWSNGGNIFINASQSVDLGKIITDRSATKNQEDVQGKLEIKKRNASDNLEVKQTTSSALNVFGTTTFDLFNDNAGNNTASAINLISAGNIFTGNILFTSAGNVTIRNNTATKLGASDIKGAFTLISPSGDVSQSGSIAVGGLTVINAAAHSVVLDNSNNDFNTIDFSNTIKNLTLKDRNALTLVDDIVANGGADGKVEITTLSGVLKTKSITTSATGLNAGEINLTGAGGIELGGDLLAVGTNGAGGNVSLNNTVTLLNAATTIDASGSARGDISFGGALTALTSARDLDLIGKNISFVANVGDATNRIGEITANATAGFGSGDHSFYATSFDLTAPNIFANILDSYGGAVTLKGTDTVTVAQISAQGIAVTQAGGNVTVGGADITLGSENNVAVNTAGNGTGLAGDIKITATQNGTPSITINGDINSGVKVAELTLVGANVTDGQVDLHSYSLASGFTSSLKINGSSGVDTITGNSIANTWDLINGTIKKTGTSSTPFITFTDFANVSGGSGVDTFNLEDTFTGIIDGKAGNDIFNVVVGTALTANLVGGGGTDELHASNDLRNVWSVGGTTESLNATLMFSGIEKLYGGTLKDTFTVTGVRGGVIDAGTGTEDDIVLVNSDMTVDFTQSDINGIQNAEIIQNTGGGAVKLTTINTSGTSNWKIWDFDADAGSDADGINDGEITFNSKTIKFLNFSSLVGGTGNDIFTFEGAATISGLIDGGGGSSNIVNLSAATGDRTVEIGTTVNAANLTVTGMNSITANSDATITSTLLVSSAVTKTNTWAISDANSGSVDGITFANFKNLTGGDGADIFDFSSVLNAGSVIGIIDGGSGSNTIKARIGDDNTWVMTGNASGSSIKNTASSESYVNKFSRIQNFVGAGSDTMDFSTVSGVVAVDLGTGVIGASGITSFIGNYNVAVSGSSSKITGPNAPSTNDWQITGANKGSINSTVGGVSTLINFEKFNILTGGTGTDDFTITSTGSLYGSINGGGGTNTLTRGGTETAWVLDSSVAKAGTVASTIQFSG